MRLTADDLIAAILSARHIEKLQNELREALIDQLMKTSPSKDGSAIPTLTGAPTS